MTTPGHNDNTDWLRLDRPIQCQTCGVRTTSLCAAMPESDLGRLHAIVSHTNFAAGRAIFYEGDSALNLYNVTAGVVRLSKLLADGRRQVTGFLFAGDFLGLAFEDQYSYTAEAVSDVQLCRFRRNDLTTLFDDYRDLERRLLTMASHELATAQEQMLVLGRKTAAEKLASFLAMVGARTHAEETIQLPMTRADIADYLGLTVETVSRTFAKLVQMGLIRLQTAQTIVVRDADRLAELADAGEG